MQQRAAWISHATRFCMRYHISTVNNSTTNSVFCSPYSLFRQPELQGSLSS